MTMTPNSKCPLRSLSSTASVKSLFEGGIGFLFCNSLILSTCTTPGPPRHAWTCSFNPWIVVVPGSTDGNVTVMLGFRADFKVTDTVGLADSDPGAGGGAGFVLGGRGCGGLESLGKVYCSQIMSTDVQRRRHGESAVARPQERQEKKRAYRYSHLIGFGIKDMVRLVLCGLVVYRSEELFGEL